MATVTQRGGSTHTGRKGFWAFLVFSLLLHLPLTPLAGLLGLLWWWQSPVEVPDLGEIRGIPIELLTSDPGANLPAPALVADPDSPEAPTEVPQDAGAPPPKDAGADAATEDAGADAGPDATAEDASDADANSAHDGSDLDAGNAVNDAADAADADAGSAGDMDAGDAGGDPVALSGSAGALADSNANVRVILYTETIRSHSLGVRVGRILGSLYQWRDFFGPTGLDPIRDIDRILIAGPQFRDTSDLVAVLQHHIPPAVLRAAIDRLVQRDPNGAWLPTRVPAARASADRAGRVFVMANDHLVIVAPKSAAQDALSKGGNLSILPGKGGEVLVAYLVLPWRAFVGIPLRIPETIKWARVVLEMRPAARVALRFEAADESEATALATANELDRAVASVASVNLGLLGSFLGQSQHRFLESSHFEAKGSQVLGTIIATDAQVAAILDLLEAALAQVERRGAAKTKKVLPAKGSGGAVGRSP